MEQQKNEEIFFAIFKKTLFDRSTRKKRTESAICMHKKPNLCEKLFYKILYTEYGIYKTKENPSINQTKNNTIRLCVCVCASVDERAAYGDCERKT